MGRSKLFEELIGRGLSNVVHDHEGGAVWAAAMFGRVEIYKRLTELGMSSPETVGMARMSYGMIQAVKASAEAAGADCSTNEKLKALMAEAAQSKEADETSSVGVAAMQACDAVPDRNFLLQIANADIEGIEELLGMPEWDDSD